MKPPSTQMCLPFPEETGAVESTCAAAVSLARTSPTRGSGRGSRKGTGAGSGTSSHGSFARWSPSGFLSRTSLLSSTEDSTPFLGRWPKAGTMRAGICSARPTWERPTAASGSSSSPEAWPTPNATVANDGETPETWRARQEILKAKGYNGNGAGVPLAIAVQEAQLWPTPRASPNENRNTKPCPSHGKGHGRTLAGEAGVWPTPKASAENYGQPRENDRGDLQAATVTWHTPTTRPEAPNLNTNTKCKPGSLGEQAEAALAWPTPGANDWKGTAKLGQRRGQLDEAAEQKFASSLPDPVIPTPGEPFLSSDPSSRPPMRFLSDEEFAEQYVRRLNPLFVTWLMGLPHQWVDVKSQLERESYEAWVTASFHRLVLLLSVSSEKD